MATIMVMDDEAPIRTLIRTALESVGHEVMEAANGHDGLALYRQRPADLVIADILMPELDELDTIIELMQEFLDVKVIAISGAPEDQRMLNTARRCAIRIGTLAPPSLGSVPYTGSRIANLAHLRNWRNHCFPRPDCPNYNSGVPSVHPPSER